MEENRANCANMSFSERKVPKSIHCLLLHRGQEGRRLQTPCLLIPLPSLRDSWWGVCGGEDRVLQAAHCSLCCGAGTHVSFCLLSRAVLQHPGEQHRQPVRPPDHGQVSAGSALPPALC